MPEFCQPLPRHIAFECICARIRELREAGEKVPLKLCAASYLFDVQSARDDSGVKAQADYARMWGWSKAWVSAHMDEIRAEAEAQADFYGAARAAEKAADAENDRERPLNAARTPAERSVNADPPPDSTNPENDGDRERSLNGDRTLPERSLNTNRSHYSDCQSSEAEADTRGRPRGDGAQHDFDTTPPEVNVAAEDEDREAFTDFLSEERQALYLADLQGELERYPTGRSCDAAWNRIIQTSRAGPTTRKPVPRRWLIQQCEKHSWPRLLAAMWITAENADHPGQKYASRILSSFDENSDDTDQRRRRSRRHTDTSRRSRRDARRGARRGARRR